MQAVMKGSAVPIVEVIDGVPIVLSTNVAAVFEKRNDNIIRDIEEMLRTLPENRESNFIETQIERPSNLGHGTIKSKAYRLTRDGFTFLVMGYTGEKAAKFKWDYIDEFNRQQALLESQVLPPKQSKRTLIAGDSLAENVLRGLSGGERGRQARDYWHGVAGRRDDSKGARVGTATADRTQALEKSCDADEQERQRRRSLKARNAARARWDRVRQGGAE